MVRKQSTNRSPGTQRTPKGIVQGNILVDPRTGDPLCVKEDDNGELRLCVDTKITMDGESIDIDLNPDTDGVHIGNPDNGNTLVINNDGSLNANIVLDSKSGDNVAISAHPIADQITAKLVNTLTNANAKVIFTYTSVSDNTRLVTIRCTSSSNCTFTLKVDALVEEVLRTSPSERNVAFSFGEHLALTSGQVLTIEAQADRYFTSRGPYSTFTKLEGYLCS